MSTPDHIKTICKIGQGAECCKYLTMSPSGWQCMKVSPASKLMIDNAWASTPHVAQGDNCEGEEDLNKKD